MLTDTEAQEINEKVAREQLQKLSPAENVQCCDVGEMSRDLKFARDHWNQYHSFGLTYQGLENLLAMAERTEAAEARTDAVKRAYEDFCELYKSLLSLERMANQEAQQAASSWRSKAEAAETERDKARENAKHNFDEYYRMHNKLIRIEQAEAGRFVDSVDAAYERGKADAGFMIERMKEVVAERDALRAENACLSDALNVMQEEYQAVVAKRDRMKEAGSEPY